MWKVSRCAVIGAALLLGVLRLPWAAAMDKDAATVPGHVVDKPAYTNRLVDSNNPYLLLHAHNPVDWYPWGPEALAKAKLENRPIFVSIGYSTCYWCHVAERTIYSNPEIAKLMNEWFVNIKVDREQRPDLDSVYVLATQVIVGNAGWPNNVFLTPDLKPFFAGSYFPPSDDAFGRPGFPTILRTLHDAWTNRRQEVLNQADKVYGAMLAMRERMPPGTTAPIKPADWLTRARDAILQDYDSTHGGLGRGPTKFPRAPALNLLLAEYRINRTPRVLEAVTKTMDAMALGGIHDHLGGGFHRYSTERTWSIPHFEKMLYDNAQLLMLYAEVHQTTRSPLYRQVAEDVASYLSRQMMAPEGGFYAAQDAEVAGREGVSYLWSRKEIESILGKEAAKRFFEVYTLIPVSERGGDSLVASDEKGVLRVRMPLAKTLQRVGVGEISQVLASLAPERAKLLAARGRRTQPARDEKILVAWNGMAIDALVRSGKILQNAGYIDLARQTATRLWEQTFDPETGELKHELFGGRAQIRAYLDDYALLGVAFLSLAEATHEPVWRQRAERLVTEMLRRFSQGDTLATTAAANDLLIEPQDDGDSTAPTGTSAAVELLLQMHGVTGKQEYANSAQRIVARLSGALQQYPSLWPSAVGSLNRYPLPLAAAAKQEMARGDGSANLASPSSADHVRVTGEAHSVGSQDEITVTVLVDKGYHVNANPATFDYLIPTTLSVIEVSSVQVTYPGATLIRPKFAPEGLSVYEGAVALRAVAPKGTLPERRPIKASVRVQACNDEVCLPPATLPLTIQRK